MADSLCEFQNSEYKTTLRHTCDGKGDFVIHQSSDYESSGTDIVMIDRQDAITMAHAILANAGQEAA